MIATNANKPSALSLADLNTTVNHEPRIRDVRIGERLGMAQPLNIRTMIESNRPELETHGGIFTRSVKNTGRGRPGTEYWLNEAQTLLLCMFSRTPAAAQVRHEVIEVYMAFRRGECPTPATSAPQRRAVKVRSHTRLLPVKEAHPPQRWHCSWPAEAMLKAEGDPNGAAFSVVLHIHDIAHQLRGLLRQCGRVDADILTHRIIVAADEAGIAALGR